MLVVGRLAPSRRLEHVKVLEVYLGVGERPYSGFIRQEYTWRLETSRPTDYANKK